MLYAVWSELDYMAGYQQHDSHEFLIAFLDGLDKHLRVNHSSPLLPSLPLLPPPLLDPEQSSLQPLPGGAEMPQNSKDIIISLPFNAPDTLRQVTLLDETSLNRKSPRSDSQHRAFASPLFLRRGLSEMEPSSTGSANHSATHSQCIEVLDV